MSQTPYFTPISLPMVTVADRLREETARVMGEAFQRKALVYAMPGFGQTAITRARKHGGPVAGVVQLFLAARKAKDGPAAADTILAHLQAVRDALWTEGADMLALDIEEQEAEGAENVATLQYEHDPSRETAQALAAAIRAERAKDAARLAELVRRWGLNEQA